MTPTALNSVLWIAWLLYWYIAAIFVKATKSSESIFRRLQHTVPMGMGFFLIFHNRHNTFIYGRLFDNRAVEYAGSVITFGGLLFSVWARIHLGRYWSGIITLKEGHQLIRTGPYRFVRHPIYTGFLSATVGSALTSGTGDAIVGSILVIAAILLKIHREEELMMRTFGDEYVRFKHESARLLPFVY